MSPNVRSGPDLAHPWKVSPRPLGVVAGTPLIAAVDHGWRGFKAHPGEAR
jgi:hypothetical protein